MKEWKELNLKNIPKFLLGDDDKLNPKYQVEKVYIDKELGRCQMNAAINKKFLKSQFTFEYREKTKEKRKRRKKII